MAGASVPDKTEEGRYMSTKTKMEVKYSYLDQQYDPDKSMGRDILRDITEEMRRGYYTLGPWTEKFENAVCTKYGVRNCVGVNSGTDALFLSMKALGIGTGDTVLTTPNTFIATVGAIIATGATPKFCDVGPDYQMDLDKAEHRRVTAGVPVHLTGLAHRSIGWPLIINDAAQAVGAEYDGISVTRFQHVACFSLHPLKNLHGAGDGGFITTDDNDLAKDLRLLRNHGLFDRDTVVRPGYNSRLDSLQAIFAWHGLQHIDEINDIRRLNAARYDEGLRGLPGVTVPARDPRALQVYHTYIIQVARRAELIKYLTEKGIEAKIHYPVPCHLQPGMKRLGYKKGDFPVCEAQADCILSLPIHEYLLEDQVDYVMESIRSFFGPF